MLRKVYVWGDSIAKGIVFDAARGRYVGLRERSGFSRAAEALHVEMENHGSQGVSPDESFDSKAQAEYEDNKELLKDIQNNRDHITDSAVEELVKYYQALK